MRIRLIAAAVVGLALACLCATIGETAPQESPSSTAEPATAPPDLSGVWYTRDHHYTMLPKSVQLPLQPDALAALNAREEYEKANADPTDVEDPTTQKCIPPGIPRVLYHPFPFEVIQSKNRVIMLFEFNRQVREIYLDRREHPKNLEPTYMGDSVGWYEGNTLVVDSVGFRGDTWLDTERTPHSDQLHLIEHISRPDGKTLKDDFTVNDPKDYTKTWTATNFYELKPDWSITEYVCEQNNRFMNSTATPH